MKSVRFHGQGKASLVDAPMPRPGPDEVLVDIRASALCGSELKLYHALGPSDLAIGHEMMGVVVEAPPGAPVSQGQRVGIYVLRGCGRCAACRDDRIAWCREVGVIMGGQSEYVVAPVGNCIPIPDDIPDDAGVLMTGDGLGVAYHVNDRVNVRPGEWVVVVGVGPVGLGAVLLTAHLGARVAAVDQSPYRLERARVLGAVETLNVRDGDVLEHFRELTEGAGADVAFECAGKGETLNLALDAVRPGGRVGICGENPQAEIRPSDQFIRKELTVYGSWYFRMGDAPRLFDLYRQGMDARALISHRFPLERAAEAHACFASGETGKVLIIQEGDKALPVKESKP